MPLAIIFKTVGLYSWLSRRSEVRRGEKVPSTFGTVANRFVELENLSGIDSEWSVLVFDGAECPALRAGEFVWECPGLLLQERGDGPFGHASGDDGSELLHVLEVHRLARAGLPCGSLGSNFSPVGRQFPCLLEILRREFDVRHGLSCLVLETIFTGEFLLPC
jgi:hypothetical protein